MKRVALLYLEPNSKSYGDHHKFAQCSTCPMWSGPEYNVCSIHGKNFTVKGTATCGLYVNGKPMGKMAYEHAHAFVTPDQSGFEDREVRCENCHYFHGNCILFKSLGIDDEVSPVGCCNANEAKKKPTKSEKSAEKPSNRFFKKS